LNLDYTLTRSTTAGICPQRTGNFTSMVRTLALLSKDFQFYEMEDPDLGAPNQQVEEKV
jgi:hypothetical protein